MLKALYIILTVAVGGNTNSPSSDFTWDRLRNSWVKNKKNKVKGMEKTRGRRKGQRGGGQRKAELLVQTDSKTDRHVELNKEVVPAYKCV